VLKVPAEHERVAVVLGRPGDDAVRAVATWRAIAAALRLADVRVVPGARDSAPLGVHPTRWATLLDVATGSVLGVVGEVAPEVAARAVPTLEAGRRLGWLDVDLLALGDPARATRRDEAASMPSRYPSSDVDLALVLDEAVHVDEVKRVLAEAAGEWCESVRCFDAYRGPGVPDGHRSLALRVRLCAPDRTLSEAALSEVRAAMIDAATTSLAATLR